MTFFGVEGIPWELVVIGVGAFNIAWMGLYKIIGYCIDRVKKGVDRKDREIKQLKDMVDIQNKRIEMLLSLPPRYDRHSTREARYCAVSDLDKIKEGRS